MPNNINRQDAAQQRTTKLLLAMGVIVIIGAVAYFGLTLYVNRRVPANPDTTYTAANGITVNYEGEKWPVCEMTVDDTLGEALKLASSDDSESSNYQVVLLQHSNEYDENFISQSESDLKEAYGVISPRKVNIKIDGASVTAVRCDIQAYYAVLAVIQYDSGDVVYVSGLTELASINDIVNVVESIELNAAQ